MKNTKIKTLLFGLFLATTFALKAQDDNSYEYAELSIPQGFKLGALNVVVVYSDRETETIQTGLSVGNATSLSEHEAILKAVGQKTKEGWIVINVTTNNPGAFPYPIYFLKRRKL